MSTARPTVFKSVNSVIHTLQDCQHYESSEIYDLLGIYNSISRVDLVEKKYPLIAFEGLDGSGKSTIMKVLKKKINCETYATPPECLKSCRGFFDDKPPELRRAFYSLGNYIAAEEIKEMLKQTPVLLDRFWHSTCAFALANDAADISNLPPEDSGLYKWPEDLLKPDAVIFLHVPENLRIERLSRRSQYTAEEDRLKNDDNFRNTLLTAYRRMQEPSLIKINSIKSPKKVADFILNKLADMDVLLQTDK